MSQKPTQRLRSEEITALMFAARRQLTRWATRPKLQPHAQTQRTALIRAVRVLEDRAFVDGCEVRRISDH
jgi:hypothetical protein